VETLPRQSRVVKFGVFEADLEARELRKSGVRQRLTGQPFQVLRFLLEHPQEVVTREQLQMQLWPDNVVVDYDLALKKAVNRIREVLGDSAESPRFLETVPRRGYRFIAEVHENGSLAAVPTTNSVPAETPTAPATQRTLWVVLLAVAGVFVLLLAAWVWVLPDRRGRLLGRQQPSEIQSLAILPLQNLSGDPTQEYFADGMTEELTTDLARFGAIRVISRSSAMQYKNANKPLRQIARELNVDGIVEGSVQRSGSKVRVTAQLIYAPTDTHLWAESYERDLQDILSLEDEVSRDIANQVKLRLTPEEQARLSSSATVSPQAYESYLQGLYYWNMRTEEGLNKSVAYFRDAIDKDPRYARAYAGLALSYVVMSGYNLLPKNQAFPPAKVAALKALELDDGLAEAHAAMAAVYAESSESNNPVAAEKEIKRAIELNPNYASAHQFYGEWLSGWGRHADADAQMKRALELDPLSIAANTWYQGVLHKEGRDDDAIAQLQKSLRVAGNVPITHFWLGRRYLDKKMNPEAINEFRTAVTLSRDQPFYVAWLGYACAVSGRTDEAGRILNQLTKSPARTYVPAYEVAALAAALGHKDQALQWLQRACDDGSCSGSLGNVKSDPAFDIMRSDPRFVALLNRTRR
jgi:TolB-like protein/DNA-binding winged helix-turn-helix (wHTH) protein/Tfp pilus assembly protein PilF